MPSFASASTKSVTSCAFLNAASPENALLPSSTIKAVAKSAVRTFSPDVSMVMVSGFVFTAYVFFGVNVQVLPSIKRLSLGTTSTKEKVGVDANSTMLHQIGNISLIGASVVITFNLCLRDISIFSLQWLGALNTYRLSGMPSCSKWNQPREMISIFYLTPKTGPCPTA